MSKYILGSGLVGLIARDILGEEWKIIPQNVSRYYSYPVALADDFITTSNRGDYSFILTPDKKVLKRAFSWGGQMVFAPLRWIADAYTSRIHGEPIPGFLNVVEMEAMVSKTSCHELYGQLLEKYMDEVTAAHEKFGKLIAIERGTIKTEKLAVEYDQIVSTIPLYALGDLVGVEYDLPSKDVWIYHIKTNELDFEGADQVLVVDEESSFYKVNRIGPNDYIFFCLEEVKTPTEYFGLFTNNNLLVMNRVHCEAFIPIGAPPDISAFEKDYSIKCVGSHAQHDALADIGTCILRIFRI